MVRNENGTWKRQYNLTDHLGNTRAVLAPNAAVLQQTDYYPFGAAFSITNIAGNKYLYGGKELQSETLGGTLFGMSDFEARFYDPRIGQFTGNDPLMEKYTRVGGRVYCMNNPVNLVDRDGKQSWPPMAKHAMGLDTYISSHQGAMKVIGEQVRGTLNSAFTILAIPQAIIAGPTSEFSSDGKPPAWCTPIQLNENFGFELKPSWLDENLSWEDGKEVIKNTLGAILFFTPFSQAESGAVRVIENTIISTSITSSVDGVDKLSSSQSTNQNSTSVKQEKTDETRSGKSVEQLFFNMVMEQMRQKLEQ